MMKNRLHNKKEKCHYKNIISSLYKLWLTRASFHYLKLRQSELVYRPRHYVYVCVP